MNRKPHTNMYQTNEKGLTRLTMQYLNKIKVNKVREVVVPKEVIKG